MSQEEHDMRENCGTIGFNGVHVTDACFIATGGTSIDKAQQTTIDKGQQVIIIIISSLSNKTSHTHLT